MAARHLATLLVLGGCCLGALGGEEEEPPPTPTAVSISVMLLGSIGFQMFLFYLVNWNDTDIKRYAWRVISQTISIFCAVLLFQAFNGIVEGYATRADNKWIELLVDILQMLFWLTVTQAVLAVTSGAVNEKFGIESPESGSEREKKMLENVELQVKSWSVLFSHIAGFSAINGWGSVQQTLLAENPVVAFLVVPLGLGGTVLTFHCFDLVRNRISMTDDGKKDAFEKKWDEETEEAENDVAGLSLSFLTVQAIRFYLSGSLPNSEGHDTGSPGSWHLLLGWGLGFGFVEIVVIVLQSRLLGDEESEVEGEEEESDRMHKARRFFDIASNFFIFGMCWCFFYAAKWGVTALHLTDEESLLAVVVALGLSAASFIFIFVLDKVQDKNLLGERSDDAVERLICGFGILIGFSWEQGFDTAVAVVAGSLEARLEPTLTKLIMSSILVAIVFPAWRYYILPTEQRLSSEATAAGFEKGKLRHFATQHFELFVSEETSEHDLHRAHLRLLHKRRTAHGKRGGPPLLAPGMKHFQVHSHGVEEITHGGADVEAGARRKSGHREITERLLG